MHSRSTHLHRLTCLHSHILCAYCNLGSTQVILKTLFGWPPNNNVNVTVSFASKGGHVQNKQKAMQLTNEKCNKNTRNTMYEQSGKKRTEKGKYNNIEIKLIS